MVVTHNDKDHLLSRAHVERAMANGHLPLLQSMVVPSEGGGEESVQDKRQPLLDEEVFFHQEFETGQVCKICPISYFQCYRAVVFSEIKTLSCTG